MTKLTNETLKYMGAVKDAGTLPKASDVESFANRLMDLLTQFSSDVDNLLSDDNRQLMADIWNSDQYKDDDLKGYFQDFNVPQKQVRTSGMAFSRTLSIIANELKKAEGM